LTTCDEGIGANLSNFDVIDRMGRNFDIFVDRMIELAQRDGRLISLEQAENIVSRALWSKPPRMGLLRRPVIDPDILRVWLEEFEA